MRKNGYVIIGFCIFILLGCKSHENLTEIVSDLSHIIIYKTKSDYTYYVPVSLSPDKTHITSYPGKTDIVFDGGYRQPTTLTKGYLLDNQGINLNTAFLSITYQQYQNLDEINPMELYDKIIDNNPIEAIYDCGIRTRGLTKHELIEIVQGEFKNCYRLK